MLKPSKKKRRRAERLQTVDSHQAHAPPVTAAAADPSSADSVRAPPPAAGQVINIGSVRAGETSNDAVNQRKLSAGPPSTASEASGSTPLPASERSAVFDETDLLPKVVLKTEGVSLPVSVAFNILSQGITERVCFIRTCSVHA